MLEKTDKPNKVLKGTYRVTEIDKADAWHSRREEILGKKGTIKYMESNDNDEDFPDDTHAFWFTFKNDPKRFFAAAKFEKVDD